MSSFKRRQANIVSNDSATNVLEINNLNESYNSVKSLASVVNSPLSSTEDLRKATLEVPLLTSPSLLKGDLIVGPKYTYFWADNNYLYSTRLSYDRKAWLSWRPHDYKGDLIDIKFVKEGLIIHTSKYLYLLGKLTPLGSYHVHLHKLIPSNNIVRWDTGFHFIAFITDKNNLFIIGNYKDPYIEIEEVNEFKPQLIKMIYYSADFNQDIDILTITLIQSVICYKDTWLAILSDGTLIVDNKCFGYPEKLLTGAIYLPKLLRFRLLELIKNFHDHCPTLRISITYAIGEYIKIIDDIKEIDSHIIKKQEDYDMVKRKFIQSKLLKMGYPVNRALHIKTLQKHGLPGNQIRKYKRSYSSTVYGLSRRFDLENSSKNTFT